MGWGGAVMARFIGFAKWTTTGAAGTRSAGFVNRAQINRDVWESMGGKVESISYSMTTADWDLVVVLDGLSSEQVFAVLKLVEASGAVERAWAVEVLTPEQADQAASVQLNWAPPKS